MTKLLCILVMAAVLALATAAPSRGQDLADRVHFLIVADTVDRYANTLGLDLDRDRMKKVIQDTMSAHGYKEGAKYTIAVLDANRMTEKNVLDYYRQLKVGTNETLVFYYTGHGGFHPEKGHLLAMRNFYTEEMGKTSVKYASVDRKELLGAMGRHQPRAIVVLTDCCASSDLPILSATKIQPPDHDFKGKLQGQGKGEIAKDLFFRAKGIVNITAAMTGTPARGDRNKGGSHFTVALEKLLRESPQAFDDDKNNVVDWREFFPRLTTMTQIESYRMAKDSKGQGFADFHTPEGFLLGEPVQKGSTKSGGIAPVLEKDDSLTTKEPTYKKGDKTYFIKNYRVKLQAGKAYLVSLFSSQFDTFLFVKDTTGKTLAFNDDYGNTTTRSRVLFFPAQTGDFDVGVSSYGPGETGDYSLMVQESTFSDALAANDAKDRYCIGSHAKRHAVHLKAQRSYTIRLESEDARKLDPFLRIVDDYGNTVALNDDEDEPQGRLNSLVTFRTVSAGTYHIVATTFAPGEIGRYAVFIQD